MDLQALLYLELDYAAFARLSVAKESNLVEVAYSTLQINAAIIENKTGP